MALNGWSFDTLSHVVKVMKTITSFVYSPLHFYSQAHSFTYSLNMYLLSAFLCASSVKALGLVANKKDRVSALKRFSLEGEE